MKCRQLLLVALLLATVADPVAAGIFGKKGKPTPAERVPELLSILKTDGDERKRASAAEELRQHDAKQFPNIVPTLIDVLMTDPKPGVRAEAAQTLSKLRPVSKEAGWALEQAIAKDASMRVRLQARSALLHYHLAGYHGGKDVVPPLPAQSSEPPLAAPAKSASVDSPAARITAKPVSQPSKSTPSIPAMNSGNDAKPMPAGPALVPTEAPKLKPAPSSGDQGPELNSPE
jgi:hypothetical protein